jgi:hypothetical protein
MVSLYILNLAKYFTSKPRRKEDGEGAARGASKMA